MRWRELNSGAPAGESMSEVILKGDSIVRVPSTAAVAASKHHDVFAVIIPFTAPTANPRHFDTLLICKLRERIKPFYMVF